MYGQIRITPKGIWYSVDSDRPGTFELEISEEKHPSTRGNSVFLPITKEFAKEMIATLTEGLGQLYALSAPRKVKCDYCKCMIPREEFWDHDSLCREDSK